MDDVSPLFAALVDDAGLFPPERLPMAAALARHRADLAAGDPVLSHRFLCPASAVDDLRVHLGADEDIRIGLIVDTGITSVVDAVAAVATDVRLRLETVEVALPVADVLGAAERHVPDLATLNAGVFVEIPRHAGWRGALTVVAAHGVGAKIRCGGVRADLFPTNEELAVFVSAAVAAGVAFKATAGLHHAVRHRDPRTGVDHHGFLNLLIAVCRAVREAPHGAVAAALALDDPEVVAGLARAVPDTVATAARRALIAYGSCNTSEPLDDLRTLGLI